MFLSKEILKSLNFLGVTEKELLDATEIFARDYEKCIGHVGVSRHGRWQREMDRGCDVRHHLFSDVLKKKIEDLDWDSDPVLEKHLENFSEAESAAWFDVWSLIDDELSEGGD